MLLQENGQENLSVLQGLNPTGLLFPAGSVIGISNKEPTKEPQPQGDGTKQKGVYLNP